MQSLLQGAIQTVGQIPFEQIVMPAIAILLFIYLTYKTVYKREDGFIKAITGVPALYVMIALFTMAVLPAEIVSTFGPAGFLFELYILPIMSAVLIGIFFASLVTYLSQIVRAELEIKGF